jgi:hypothetical protein
MVTKRQPVVRRTVRISDARHRIGDDGHCQRCGRHWSEVIGTACDTERSTPSEDH